MKRNILQQITCLFINRPKKIKQNYEPTFKVDLGNGIKPLSWTMLNNLTDCDKDYIFKKAKQCSQLTVNIPNFNTDNVPNFTDYLK